MILVAGLPASGKNYITEQFVDHIDHICVLDKDDLGALVDCAFRLSGQESNRDGSFYTQHIKAAEYETLMQLAFSALRYEDTVLVNAPFLTQLQDEQYMKTLAEKIHRMGATLLVIWTHAPWEIMRERMLKRGAIRDTWKLTHWDEYQKQSQFAIPYRFAKYGWLDRLYVVDTSKDEEVRTLLEQL